MAIFKKKLLSIIEDYFILGMTCYLSIVDKKKQLTLGKIYFEKGVLVSSYYGPKKGMRALIQMLIDEPLSDGFMYQSCAKELGPINEKNIAKPFISMLELILWQLKETRRLLPIRPPGHFYVSVENDFIWQGMEVTDKEFEIMVKMTHPTKVDTIFNESPYLEYEMTQILTSLRHKKAIKIISLI